MCENQFVGGHCCLKAHFNNVFEWTVGPQGQKAAENQKLWAIAQQTRAPIYEGILHRSPVLDNFKQSHEHFQIKNRNIFNSFQFGSMLLPDIVNISENANQLSLHKAFNI